MTEEPLDAMRCDAGHIWLMSDGPECPVCRATNAHTEPCDTSKRPFDQVADSQGIDIAAEIPVEWPDPPPEVLLAPAFLAIFEVIKTWDINVPAAYGGYCGATGNHVYAIYRAMAPLAPKTNSALTFEVWQAQVARITALEADKATLQAECNSWATVARDLAARLAAFTAPASPGPKAFPAAALRPSRSDLRRVGG